MTVTSDTARYTARIVRGSRSAAVGTSLFAIATLVLALLPWWGSNATQFTLIEVLYYLSLAQLWNLLAGYAGLVSVGQQGFVGVGAYATFIFAERNGVDPWVSLVLAGLFVAALSVPVALFAFRLEGGYFAIGTWVIAEVFRLVILQIDSIGAGNVQSFTVKNTWAGYSLETRNDLIYWVALGLGAGATILSFLIVRSRLGLALQATRDSAGGAKAVGVNVTLTKMVVWVVVAAGAGVFVVVVVVVVVVALAERVVVSGRAGRVTRAVPRGDGSSRANAPGAARGSGMGAPSVRAGGAVESSHRLPTVPAMRVENDGMVPERRATLSHCRWVW